MKYPFGAQYDELKGRNLVLKPLAASHQVPLRKAGAFREIWGFMLARGWEAPAFNQWFEETLQAVQERRAATYSIWKTSDGSCLGVTGFKEVILEHDRATLGPIWLTPTSWGSGAGTEATFMICQYLFEKLDAYRIDMRTDTDNNAMQIAFRKLGGRHEGTLRALWKFPGGERHDYALMSLLAPEWPEVRKRFRHFSRPGKASSTTAAKLPSSRKRSPE